MGSVMGAPLCLALIAGPARAQTPPAVRFFEMRVPPRVVQETSGPALTPPQQNSFDRARALRETGRLDAARDTLTKLLAQVPHHPMALAELARVHAAKHAWKAVEALARAERQATHDSTLLAAPLVEALARQGRPRDAAQAVFESVASDAALAGWARDQLDTLCAREPRAVRDLARRESGARPGREDLALLSVRLDWRYGDEAQAMRTLAAAENDHEGGALHLRFQEEMLRGSSAHDSAGAAEALLDLAQWRTRGPGFQVWYGQRAWEIASRLGTTTAMAPRVARALKDVPADRWGNLLLPVMRALREGEPGDEARALLKALSDRGAGIPEIALERALTDLKDGPPLKALPALEALADSLPEAAFRRAEALFFSGQPESARVAYERVARDPGDPNAGAALENLYLIEDGRPREALVTYGALAWQRWRGDTRQALALADSLFRTLEKGPLWAHAALALSALREQNGDGKGALAPALALAENLPDDRLAPAARQRAGDVLRVWYHDDAKALAQYEECLARYPKAWNTAEVRRWVEALRRERRF